MSVVGLRKQLQELRRIAILEARQNPYLPKSHWPDALVEAHKAFIHRAHASPDSWVYLLDHLDALPPLPMKPEFDMMRSDPAQQQKLYEIVRNRTRI